MAKSTIISAIFYSSSAQFLIFLTAILQALHLRGLISFPVYLKGSKFNSSIVEYKVS